jgi:hypothetical protein
LDDGQQLHARAAMRAARNGLLGNCRLGFVDLAAHQRSDAQPGLACRAAHPSVMANPHKPLWKHMREPTAQEGLDRKCDDMRATWPPKPWRRLAWSRFHNTGGGCARSDRIPGSALARARIGTHTLQGIAALVCRRRCARCQLPTCIGRRPDAVREVVNEVPGDRSSEA